MIRIVSKALKTTVAWLRVEDERDAQAVFDEYVERAGGDRSGYFYIIEEA